MAPTPKIYQLMNELIKMGVVIKEKRESIDGQDWILYIPCDAFHQ